MTDISMTWSGDLLISPTGDLGTVSGPPLGTERILRRLLTNPDDYIWNPDYGAGLAQFVGQPVDPAAMEALVRGQMSLETAVAQDPEPVIAVQSDVAGLLYVEIRYVDADTATATAMTVNVLG